MNGKKSNDFQKAHQRGEFVFDIDAEACIRTFRIGALDASKRVFHGDLRCFGNGHVFGECRDECAGEGIARTVIETTHFFADGVREGVCGFVVSSRADGVVVGRNTAEDDLFRAEQGKRAEDIFRFFLGKMLLIFAFE